MSNPDLPSEDRSRKSSSEIGGTLGVIALISFVFGALARPTSTSRFRILGCFLRFCGLNRIRANSSGVVSP